MPVVISSTVRLAVAKLTQTVRTLADIAWQGVLPPDLADTEVEEERRREELRVIKTRVAMGELDLIGPDYWAANGKDLSATLTKPRRYESPASAQRITDPSTQAEHLDEVSGQPEPASAPQPSEKSQPAEQTEPAHHEAVFATSM